MPSIGPTELIIVLVIVVIIFGAGKIGDIGGALGRGIREFKENTNDPNPDKLDTGSTSDLGGTTTATSVRREEPVMANRSTGQQVRADEI
jgi:sec-independent protein translocase protein TatA